MLIARDLCLQRGRRQILHGIDLQLPAGRMTGILGANGAGKSTLLAALAGELAPAAGVLTLLEQPLAHWTPEALARQRAVLPQNPSLQFDLPVATVIGMGAYPHAGGPARHASAGWHRQPAQTGLQGQHGQGADAPRQPASTSRDDTLAACTSTGGGPGDEHAALPGGARDDQQVLQRALDLADVNHLYNRRYRELSGGEQQRVQFARVLHQLLLARPPGEYRLLLLDEPTASLDPRHQLSLLRAVRSLTHDDGIAACVILHDVNLAAGCCDQLLLLAEGTVAASGTPAEVLTPPILRRVYGVEATVLPHPHQPERPLVVFDVSDRGSGHGQSSQSID